MVRRTLYPVLLCTLAPLGTPNCTWPTTTLLDCLHPLAACPQATFQQSTEHPQPISGPSPLALPLILQSIVSQLLAPLGPLALLWTSSAQTPFAGGQQPGGPAPPLTSLAGHSLARWPLARNRDRSSKEQRGAAARSKELQPSLTELAASTSVSESLATTEALWPAQHQLISSQVSQYALVLPAPAPSTQQHASQIPPPVTTPPKFPFLLFTLLHFTSLRPFSHHCYFLSVDIVAPLPRPVVDNSRLLLQSRQSFFTSP